jgi:hypothetical protein
MSLPTRDSVRNISTRSSGSEHDELNDDLKSTHNPDLEKTDGTTTTGLNLAYDKGPTAGRNTVVGEEGEEEFDPYVSAGGVDRPWKYKGPALTCIIFLTRKSGCTRIAEISESKTSPFAPHDTVGSNFAQSSLSPLKSTIRKQVPGVNNARYGTIASADYGPSGASLVASTCILVGCVVRAIGGSTGSFST